MPIVRLDKVSLSFGRKPLLDHIALQIRKGERVCLLGRNGEGKSSLLRVITREIVPDSGEVWIRPGRAKSRAWRRKCLRRATNPCSRVVEQGVSDGRRGRRLAGASCRWIRSSRGCSSIAMRRCAPCPAAGGGA